jgi:hypothetical protein
VKVEYTVEESDVNAFLDYHCHHSKTLQELRRSQIYGYAILLAIFAVIYWLFGETSVAIAFLVLGPIWAAWWPSRTRRLARKQVTAALSSNQGAQVGHYALELLDTGLLLRTSRGDHRVPTLAIREVANLRDHLLMYVAPLHALIVPKRTAKGDLTEFVRALERLRGGLSLPDLLQRQP